MLALLPAMPRSSAATALRHDFADRPAEIDFEPLAAGHFEPARIEPQPIEHRGVQVGHVVPMLGGVEAELVGRAMDNTPLNAGARQPHREPVRMMVAAVGPLRTGRAAELASPNDERFVEQSALFEVLKQRGDRLIDLLTKRGVARLQPAMRIPRAGATVGAMEQLHEPHAPLDQAPRRQALLAEGTRDVAIETIERLRFGSA